MRIGFLGLGHMGSPMARNLLGPEHTVTVYNRTPGGAKSLVNLGAIEANSVAEAVKDAEVAITMLSDDAAVNEVVHGPFGLIRNLPPKAIHLCMCTIGVEASAALASAHAQANQGYVAAPVFGRADAVESRHIWIVAGGSEPQVNRCRPIFDALAQGYTRVGPNAALAHALKLGGNILSITMELAVAEMLTYAKGAGLSPADYLRFLNTAIFRSHMVDSYRGGTVRPSFDPEDQALDLAANELLLQKSKDMGVAIPVEDLLNVRIQAAGARGWGEQDIAELAQACRMETGGKGISIPEVKVSLLPPAVPPPVDRTVKRTSPEPKKVAPPKQPTPQLKVAPRPIPPVVEREVPKPPIPNRPASPEASITSAQAEARPTPPVVVKKSADPNGPVNSTQEGPFSPYAAMDGKLQVALDLEQTSHFEVIKGHVWAWSEGKRYATRWSKLGEVELAFNHVLFLSIQRHVLLRPEAVLNLRPVFGGGAKARVGEHMELDVSRSAAPRLKELLGL
jgi:3-hydroxyisobutyrate dehydrogenase-like beta-hydroxyacid dehydrogenase